MSAGVTGVDVVIRTVIVGIGFNLFMGVVGELAILSMVFWGILAAVATLLGLFFRRQ